MNNAWKQALPTLATAPLALALACGGANSNQDPLQTYSHYHKGNWVLEHPTQAMAGVDACTKCHELSVLRVGSAIPGCLASECHHQATPNFADPALHGAKAKLAAGTLGGGGLADCTICHGPTFEGGPSGFACASCHGVAAPHPAKPWRITAGSSLTHATTDPSNAVICLRCHYPGSPNNPTGHPFNPAPAGTEPGCFNNTLCHGASPAPHAVPFLAGQVDSLLNGHFTVTTTAFASDCSQCHAYAGISPTAGAPLCSTCHTQADPTSMGSDAGTCLSCHTGGAGLPQGPGGSSFPSLSGAHARHMGLATALTCDTCHAGSGSGTVAHYTNADGRTGIATGPAPVSLDVVFTAKTGGTPAFTASTLTCAAVSCHGGQATPNWQNGTLDVNAQCTSCHGVVGQAGLATQYNDAFGRHSMGTHDATKATNGIACTTCHDMNNGSPGALAHFKYLNTQAVDGVSTGTPADQLPSGTLVFDPSLVSGARTYTVNASTQGNGGCTLTCHSHNHVPTINTWTASGAPHPVPFLAGQTDAQGNGHLTASAAAFAADCSACHAQSGTSPMSGAPLCSTCHTLGDPTASGSSAGTCLSCHSGPAGIPAGPTGSSFPSIAGAHAKHMALATPLTCDTCHAGSGTGTSAHYSQANARVNPPTGPGSVAIDATYNAQTGGAATFTPSTLTCAAASCHGGQTTPNWRTGSMDASTQCTACHAINGGTSTSQYNDAVGRHAWGTHLGAATLDCTLCHDMSSANAASGAQNHFKYLNTSAVSGAATGSPSDQMPSGTIKFKLTSTTYPITGSATYTITGTTPEGDGGCTLTCHTMNHVPATNHWGAPKGSGIAHPIPFLSTDTSTNGNHHQTLTQAQFDGECVNCHDASGTSTKTGPVCTVCHTLGSPLASGMTAGTCLSCHVGSSFTTQGPTGSAWPNLAGAHAKHAALSTFTRTSPALPSSITASSYPVCESCHVGSVPGDSAQTHYSNANKRATSPISSGPASVSVNATFNAQSGTAGITASASAFTCSNISCHGGQVTPGWQSGKLTFNATTYCTSCHTVGAAQYNAPTGRHSDPGEHRQTCDTCHDMTQAKPGAQNHFKYLDTQAVSGVSGTPSDQYPSDTIAFNASVTGSRLYVVTSTTQGQGGCTLVCHTQNHTATNNKWN